MDQPIAQTDQTSKPLTDKQKKPFSPKKVMLVLLILVIPLSVIGFMLLANLKLVNAPFRLFTNSAKQTQQDATVQDTTSTDNTAPRLPQIEIKNRFAEFSKEQTPFTPKLSDYTLKVSELDNLQGFKDKKQLTVNASQTQALETNNFYISKNTDKFYDLDKDKYSYRNDDWTYLYEAKIARSNVPTYDRASEDAAFVSSDVIMHVFHKLLSKEFSLIEQKYFYPKLSTLTDDMLTRSVEKYRAAQSDAQKASYLRLIQFFAVPKAVLATASGLDTDLYAIKDENIDTYEKSMHLVFPFPE